MNLIPHNKSCAKHEQNKTMHNVNNKSNQLDLVFWIQNVTHLYTEKSKHNQNPCEHKLA